MSQKIYRDYTSEGVAIKCDGSIEIMLTEEEIEQIAKNYLMDKTICEVDRILGKSPQNVDKEGRADIIHSVLEMDKDVCGTAHKEHLKFVLSLYDIKYGG